MKKVLTIAGSDCSGGAGIQADLKTIAAHKMYGMSAITALTAQNTTGVYGILESTPEFLANQLDCIFTDIFPDAVKIGMVSSAPLIRIIAQKLGQYAPKNIVVDPVMISTSGSKLLADDAAGELCQQLLPLATLLTPNLPEAEVLSGLRICSEEDMIAAAQKIAQIYPCAILVKGGHFGSSADDLLYLSGECHWFRSARIQTKNTHGTGCTLSSAIACNLAAGDSLPDSVLHAKKYVGGALADGLNLGAGNGPLNHCYALNTGLAWRQ